MQQKILIENAAIVTMTEESWIENGYITISGNRIQEVGSGSYQGDRSFDKILDASGKVVMPGLVNAHGHAAMVLLRGYADDLPLMEWLQTKCWPIEDRMTEEDIHWGTQLAILEMLKTGTTCFTDMYFHMDGVAKAVESSGIRAVLSRGMIGFPPKADTAIAESRDFFNRWNCAANGRISVILGPHAPYTCPPDYLKRVAELSAELNVPIQIHLSETAGEVERCMEEHGCTPIRLMEQVGLFERPTLAAHCVHVTDEDLDIMARYNVHVAHNPDSNLKLGSGVAPAVKMLQKGLIVGLGTDGAASNNNLDMFEEMRQAAMLHKGVNLDPIAVSAYKALEMATKDGAKALFLEDRLGTVQSGALADLIMLDFNRPYYYPRHNVIAHLVYAGQSGDVTDVIVDGQLLVENRRVLTMDEERIYREVEAVCERLFK
ncbi:amidohydrolase [Effusibacillus lacus]|uniref:5-methylthioadenosine/S-adenosylhomocysteine deaminase n=1 Tax=Effusibacillus lacus TaxID=1348429 RepID=A0A292YMP7_9BACL|nr:amidohydrolase [Effusibacillus lacus]TCS75341.1 5-methylthioadenosine/S-adenosylhomocysteine deaminase [Effusibacillus lacus]GAX89775.1 N-ethylammeline chlorohydrolase [Effusibacillus lacus]